MRALIIHTPIAGRGKGDERLAALRRERAFTDEAVAEAPGHAERLAADAAGYDVVFAAGGDGTVHEVVNGLMHRQARAEAVPLLGILPFGTGNDIARNLGIADGFATLAALKAEQTRRIDLMRVSMGEQVVHGVLNCGIGFGAEVIRQTTRTVKRVFGPNWAYTVGTFRALVPWRSPQMHLVHDGGTFDGPVFFLTVGNGEWESGGTMRISPGARMDDGLLNVLVIRHGPKLEVVRNFGKIATGEHIHHPLVDYFTTTRLEVTAERTLGVQTDGDVVGVTPCTIEVVPGAIAVAAPPGEP